MMFSLWTINSVYCFNLNLVENFLKTNTRQWEWTCFDYTKYFAKMITSSCLHEYNEVNVKFILNLICFLKLFNSNKLIFNQWFFLFQIMISGLFYDISYYFRILLIFFNIIIKMISLMITWHILFYSSQLMYFYDWKRFPQKKKILIEFQLVTSESWIKQSKFTKKNFINFVAFFQEQAWENNEAS
jgi:hypothetical protein